MIESKDDLKVLNIIISIRCFRSVSISSIKDVLELLEYNWISVENPEKFKETCKKFIKYLNTI